MTQKTFTAWFALTFPSFAPYATVAWFLYRAEGVQGVLEMMS